MHNNVHVARITRAVLQELNIREIKWPAVSSEINPSSISVRERYVPPQTLQDLEQALIEDTAT